MPRKLSGIYKKQALGRIRWLEVEVKWLTFVMLGGCSSSMQIIWISVLCCNYTDHIIAVTFLYWNLTSSHDENGHDIMACLYIFDMHIFSQSDGRSHISVIANVKYTAVISCPFSKWDKVSWVIHIWSTSVTTVLYRANITFKTAL